MKFRYRDIVSVESMPGLWEVVAPVGDNLCDIRSLDPDAHCLPGPLIRTVSINILSLEKTAFSPEYSL